MIDSSVLDFLSPFSSLFICRPSNPLHDVPELNLAKLDRCRSDSKKKGLERCKGGETPGKDCAPEIG